MFGVLRPGSVEHMPISPETSPPPPRSMAPMPPGQYNSREELLSHAKDWAAHQGYAIVIARSRFNRLWLKCDRGGKYENRRNLTPDQRKRKRSDSRLLGCPFRMLAIIRKDGIWKVQIEAAEHNHGPSDDLSMHPTLRRLTEDQSQKVNEMMDAGKTPAETVEQLKRTWPDIKVLTRDVYNARKKYKTQKDMADLASGLPAQPIYDDPNGSFPGPTPNGRWAWVPDGEEVTSKNRKKKRRPPLEQQQILDPQLQQTPSPSMVSRYPHHDPPPGIEFQHDQLVQGARPLSLPEQQHPQGLGIQGPTQNASPFTSLNDPSDFPSVPGDSIPLSPVQPPNSAHHLQTQHSQPRQPPYSAGAETAVATSSQFPASSNPALISRIDRMEREQRDQKEMLAQILGAVRGMRGNP